MSLKKIWTIAANVFRETIRDRILYIIGFFALLLVIALQVLPAVSITASSKVIMDTGLAVMGVLGVVVAVFVGTGLINKEIEKRTVLVLIPKPINRSEFILGKHLGLSGVLAVLVAAMTVIFLILLSLSGINYPLVSILVSNLYLLLELMLITAVALVFGVFTSSALAIILAFGVYLMGHLSRDLLELGNLTETLSIQILTQGLYLILPDLSRLNLKNEAVYGLLPSPLQLIENAVYSLIYTALLLAIAIAVFSRRQF